MEVRQRVIYLDIIRIIACLLIIGAHVAALYVNTVSDEGADAVIYSVYQNMTQCGNIPYFMISGSLFLNRDEIDVRRLFGHNILRILVIYFVWSGLYMLDTMRSTGMTFGVESLLLLFQGKYHMWLLPRMIGVYCLLPVMHAMVHYKNGACVKYFVWIFLGTLVINMFFESAAFLPAELTKFCQSLLPQFFQDAGYAVCGYWLSHVSLENVKKRYLTAGYLAALLVSVVWSGRGLVFEAIFLFLFCRKWSPKPGMGERVLSYVASCMLGVVMLHVFVLEHLEGWFHLSLMDYPSAAAIPCLTVAVFFVTLLPVAVLKRIPVIQRLL